MITYKHDAFMLGTVVDVERGQFADAKLCVAVGYFLAKNSWCYTDQNVYKTASQIICDLVDL